MRRPRLSSDQLALCFDVPVDHDPQSGASCDEEEWRDIPSFPGYQASNHGRVRSFYRRGSSRLYDTPRVLAARPQTMGYPSVQLRRDGQGRADRTVHSLVLEAFIGPRPEGKIVCHEDGNFWNCRLDNLRYDTYLSNRKDMIRDRRQRRGAYAALEPAAPPLRLDDESGEQWRDVPGILGYQVSDRGRVRSFWGHRGRKMREKPVLLVATPASHGYPQVGLCIGPPGSRIEGKSGRKRVGRTVHSLVMEAFVGPCPAGKLVCHEDGNFWNCRLDNLRYDSQRSNRRDMIRDRRAGRGTFARPA